MRIVLINEEKANGFPCLPHLPSLCVPLPDGVLSGVVVTGSCLEVHDCFDGGGEAATRRLWSAEKGLGVTLFMKVK